MFITKIFNRLRTKIFNRLRYGQLIDVSNKQVACYRKNNGGGKSTYTFLKPGNEVPTRMVERKVPYDNDSTIIFRTLKVGDNVISNSSITRTPYHRPGFTPYPAFGIKYRCEKILPSGEKEVKYVTCEPNREFPSGKLYYEKSKMTILS